MANFYERGEKPLEIVTSRQWYIRNGGRDADLNAALIARGEEIDFHPAFMRSRYANWVGGLNGDWLVSRQRFFGVPIPVWYPLDADGEPDYARPLVPAEADLPVDPAANPPAGYTESQRGEPGGFVGDPDIFDTWATSSLSPQIAGGWRDAAGTGTDPLFEKVFPMDVRPQGHDIIRTWLFSTVVRAHFEHGTVPWTNAAISGWILDPDRKKMSKSRGNVVTPEDLLKEHSADAVRYWAASGRLGTDAAYDTGQIKVGRRLAIKVLNASKFALSFGDVDVDGDLAALVTEPTRPVAARRAARRRRPGHRRLRGVGLHPRPRGHRAVVLGVLRRLPRAGQGPRLRRPGGCRCRQCPCDAADLARRRAAPARPGAALRHRGGLVVDPRRLGAPRRLADRRRGAGRR